jgi:hypothetical protein
MRSSCDEALSECHCWVLLGIDHHLTKPVEPAALEELLASLDCKG